MIIQGTELPFQTIKEFHKIIGNKALKINRIIILFLLAKNQIELLLKAMKDKVMENMKKIRNI